MIKLKIVFITKRLFSTTFIRQSEVRVRFAPSPTGNIHLGGLRTALYNYIFAKQNNGKFILRIEDTDQTRIVSGSAENIESILNWANIQPDESPRLGGYYGPYKQSERLDLYKKYSNQLLELGKAYRCFCSPERLELVRRNQARNREKPRYDGKCKELSKSEIGEKLACKTRYVVRFTLKAGTTKFDDLIFGNIENNLLASKEGDPIIMKSDEYPTYHFANVIDDHCMKISHILRGSEWISSTTKHLQIYEAFEWKKPKFGHFPLITMRDGTKMSKRNNQSHVNSFIEKGFRPRALLNFLTNMGGGLPKLKQDSMEIWNLEKIVENFNFNSVTCHPASADLDRLLKYNINDIKMSWLENPSNLISEFKSMLSTKNIKTDLDDDRLKSFIEKFIEGRIVTLNDLLSNENNFIWRLPKLDWCKKPYFDEGIDLINVVKEVINIVEQIDLEDKSNLDVKFKKLAQDNNMKKSKLFMLLRKLLTNSDTGLPVYEIMNSLGRKRLIVYLRNSLTYVSQIKE